MTAPSDRQARTYLDRIMPAVLARLEERKCRVPVDALKAVAPPRPRISFARALKTTDVSLIAEVKRASPSKGPIRPDLEVAPLVATYEAAGARAISVLTEEEFFKGGPGDLQTAAASCGLPVLRKDFIVDEYQIHEAWAWGANAVLLIAALLPGAELPRLAGVAAALGLDALLEVHDRRELERALGVDRVVIGINNRDLRTFAVSLETTYELAGLVPPDRILVSESGIRTRGDVQRLAACGVNAVLVGETLLQAPDAAAAANNLMQPASAVVSRSSVA